MSDIYKTGFLDKLKARSLKSQQPNKEQRARGYYPLYLQDFSQHEIRQISLKVHKQFDEDNGSGRQRYYGIKIINDENYVLCEETWSYLGYWETFKLPEGHKLIGFHGTIWNDREMQQIGLITCID